MILILILIHHFNLTFRRCDNNLFNCKHLDIELVFEYMYTIHSLIYNIYLNVEKESVR